MRAALDEIKQSEAKDASPEEESIRMNRHTVPTRLHIRLSDFPFGELSASQSSNTREYRLFVKPGVLWL